MWRCCENRRVIITKSLGPREIKGFHDTVNQFVAYIFFKTIFWKIINVHVFLKGFFFDVIFPICINHHRNREVYIPCALL